MTGFLAGVGRGVVTLHQCHLAAGCFGLLLGGGVGPRLEVSKMVEVVLPVVVVVVAFAAVVDVGLVGRGKELLLFVAAVAVVVVVVVVVVVLNGEALDDGEGCEGSVLFRPFPLTEQFQSPELIPEVIQNLIYHHSDRQKRNRKSAASH